MSLLASLLAKPAASGLPPRQPTQWTPQQAETVLRALLSSKSYVQNIGEPSQISRLKTAAGEYFGTPASNAPLQTRVGARTVLSIVHDTLRAQRPFDTEESLVGAAIARIQSVDTSPPPARPTSFPYDASEAATRAALTLRQGKFKRLYADGSSGRVMTSLDPRGMRGDAYPAYVLLAEERAAQERIVADLEQVLALLRSTGAGAAAGFRTSLQPIADIVRTIKQDLLGVDVSGLEARLGNPPY